ncbi:unannotated protein [freshwater metagenome]|uniref:Unannotated protein n=1 Tax=freshwater metagenome TaxID=449393 RepID=A0A6J7S9N4_9ZZZZ
MLAGTELQELRSLLRQPHLAARRVAVGIISSWTADSLVGVDPLELLAAATERYPCIAREASRPTEQLARLLWSQPRCVSTAAVVDSVLQADQHARWAMIRLLVLRQDSQGVQAIQFLLSMDGFLDVLTPPSYAVFDPLLEHSAAQDHEQLLDLSALAQGFAELLIRPGWTCQIAAFLQQVQQAGRLDGAARCQVLASASSLASTIVANCNAVIGQRLSAESNADALQTLTCLASLLAAFHRPDEHSPLYRMLGSADPLVSVIGVVALTDCGMRVGADRIEMLARDPRTVSPLFRALDDLGAAEIIPLEYRTSRNLALSELVEWLSDESELGRPPDEIEWLGTWNEEELELFRFRMSAPHWSCQRGWMIGVAGAWTHSCYFAEDEMTTEEHIHNLELAVENWQAPPR